MDREPTADASRLLDLPGPGPLAPAAPAWHVPPRVAPGPLRVLWVLPWLDGDAAEEVLRVAEDLPRGRHRLDVLPCLDRGGVAPVARRLRAAGAEVDETALGLSFEDTVRHLARTAPGHDVVVAAEGVPDVHPALDRLANGPPLIERPPGPGLAVPQWERLLAEAASGRPRAPAPSLFRSFTLGGWECSTHVRRDGRRLDVLAATGHDARARQDYAQLGRLGIHAMRDGLRWHLIDAGGGYDWSSWTPMLEAARDTGAQVVWDLLHYGLPDGLDVWSPAFPERFRRFARAAALHRREASPDVPWWCPVNEMSFLSWAGGDAAYLNPFARGRGFELKCQLARAAILAMEECRDVDPRARFLHAEPLIAVHHDPASGRPAREAQGHHEAQFQAFDLVAGRLWPGLGGHEDLLDVVGVNYYFNNQWIHGGPPIDWDHPLYAPLSDLLLAAHARYGRPMILAETGVEGDRRAPWAAYVGAEVARARRLGAPVEGVCLYPIANHPGWDDDRDCPNGLLEAHPGGPGPRGVHAPLAAALPLLDPALAPDRLRRLA